ncbi:MAG: hypothetical protein V8S20_00330 [Candidatus Gastranaerophilaceae bacterium]
MNKERRDYILNNLLLFIKQELEDNGVTIDNYWFEIKFQEQVYYVGVEEPKIEPASEDTEKFLKKCLCEKGELEKVIKFGIAHEYLEKYTYNSIKITYQGINKAEEYEEYLEKNIIDNQIMLNDPIKSIDSILNEKISKSKMLFLNNDLNSALENIWDAFERIKTILNPDKRQGIKQLCERCATSLDFDILDKDFSELTNIGNNYQIRHFETNKKEILDDNTKVYLYFRVLNLLNISLKQMEDSNALK